MADTAMAELSKEEKLKLLKKTINSFVKKNETADVSIGSSEFGKVTLERSGVWAIDQLIKGLPRGMFTHIAGPSGVGKSTLMLNFIGELQRRGLTCALANNERRYTKEWAEANGVNTDELIGGNFKDLEQCLDFAIEMAETEGACDCLVVDTITAISSRGELQDKKGVRSTDDNTMALIPRKLSQFFRMATARVADSGMIVILVNQIRKDLGNSFFVKDIAVGGNALEHMKTLDIFIRKAAKSEWPMGEDDKPAGHLIHASLLKATHTMEAKNGDTLTFNFFDGRGFDNDYDIVSHARKDGLITKGTGLGNYDYVDSSGQTHTVKAKAALVDKKFTEFACEQGLLDEIRTRVEGRDLENVGEIEQIELDPEAEAEGDA